MSAQFGKCNFDGKPVDPVDLDKVRSALVPYGPDGEGFLCKDGIGILYRAFHTTSESRGEVQPWVSPSDSIVTWDGRLDNREQLIDLLRDEICTAPTDVSIVAAAYERWGTDCLSKLIGDWALSIWDSRSRSLVLAKDFVGTRHLYYSAQGEQITWSTILEPLVLCADRPFKLDEEYVAGWLSSAPATERTPYVGVHAVPPSSYVLVRDGNVWKKLYWDFDRHKLTRYKQDWEYEEHFRSAFRESVKRRLRSAAPVIAELSGGMDSSSIVCMADAIIRDGEAGTPRLDTISYFDDSEPNWNERPYFTKIETKRGRTGCHVDVGNRNDTSLSSQVSWGLTPNETNRDDNATEAFRNCLLAQGNRVLLSGFGGDEVLGGVPTPIPELADYLVTAQFRLLVRKLQEWALAKRTTVLSLMMQTGTAFLPHAFSASKTTYEPPPWLKPDFAVRNRTALTGYESPLNLFHGFPSVQERQKTLCTLRRHVGCTPLPSSPLHEVRYPCLDRDLLEFLHTIPQEQLVRPRQRRSLLRRSLSGIVPDEILTRARKAYVTREPTRRLQVEISALLEHADRFIVASIGIVDPRALASQFRDLQARRDVSLVALLRTIHLERWLRAQSVTGLLECGAGLSPASAAQPMGCATIRFLS
jgi:asparagine synthase (glutamine-hydrolysing)